VRALEVSLGRTVRAVRGTNISAVKVHAQQAFFKKVAYQRRPEDECRSAATLLEAGPRSAGWARDWPSVFP
jgi:hypothetical protein